MAHGFSINWPKPALGNTRSKAERRPSQTESYLRLGFSRRDVCNGGEGPWKTSKGVSLFARWESISFRSHPLDYLLNKNYYRAFISVELYILTRAELMSPSAQNRLIFCHLLGFDWFQPRLFFTGLSERIPRLDSSYNAQRRKGRNQRSVLIRGKARISSTVRGGCEKGGDDVPFFWPANTLLRTSSFSAEMKAVYMTKNAALSTKTGNSR